MRGKLDLIYAVPVEDLNPDISQLGPGPEGTRCGSCANLTATRIPTRVHSLTDPVSGEPALEYSDDQTIYYCTVTGQAKKVTWPACSRFVEAPLLRWLHDKPADERIDTGSAIERRLTWPDPSGE